MHTHAKGEHRPYAEERPIAYSARMLFLWFFHACRRQHPRFLMVSDHINYLTFEDPGAVNTVRRALKLAHAGDLYGAAETAGVDVAHAAVVSDGLRRGMRFSIGAEVDNDPRARPDAQNIVDAMRPDGIIRSVHFLNVEHPEKGADWSWPFGKAEFVGMFDHVGVAKTWQLYMARLLEDVEKLPGHIVGQFYGPAQFGHWPAADKLEKFEDQIVAAAHARGMAIEIYTRYLYRDHTDEEKARFVEANKRLAKKAKAAGVPLAIGSGAHSPRDQGGAFERVLELLDALGINEIVFPVGGLLRRVALRATKENLEAQSRNKEPVSPGSSIIGLGRAELGLPEEPDKAELAKRELARAGRGSAKKRSTGPQRAGKRPEKPAPAAKPGGSSRRSADSAASSSKAKAAKGGPKTSGVKAAKTTLGKPAAKAPAKKAAPPKKTALEKKVSAKKAAGVKKPAAVKAPVKKAAAKKAAPLKKAAPAKKAPAKKPPVKKLAAPKKTAVAKKAAPARKAPNKKQPVKRAAAKPAASTKKAKSQKPATKRR
ncbi:MAG: hypothetical protein ACLQPV_01170 [Vulcanimicrobiaceae bacterium]